MSQITCKITPEGTMNPCNQHDRDILLKLLEKDKKNKDRTGVYNVTIKYGRIFKTLAKYWLLMGACEYHLGVSKDYWHNTFKQTLLPKKSVYNKLLKKEVMIPDSVAYDNMDESEFETYYNNVVALLFEYQYNADEMIKTWKEAQ